jgi:hypothetical protein
MKKPIVIACFAVALIMCMVLVLRQRVTEVQPLHRQQALLLFVGFTNGSAKGDYAAFRLTNSTRAHIVCVPESIEQSNAGAWVITPLTGRAKRRVRDWVGVKEELRPGEAFTFLVPPPTTNGAWRLSFLCQERATLTDAASDLVRHVTDTNAAAHQDRQFSGRRYFVTTPEVTQ